MRILLVEDDFQLLAATARGLRNSGFAVDVADRSEDALAKTAVTEFDVVVLDRDLPGMHGDDVCRSIAAGSARILMLTALHSLDDRVAGLGLGADDYLVKPFCFRELAARIHRGRNDLCRPARVLGLAGKEANLLGVEGKLTEVGSLRTFNSDLD